MPFPDAVAGPTVTIAAVFDAPVDVPIEPPRQCGRCREYFAAERDIDPRSLREWWGCPPCRAALFPSKVAPS